MPPRNVLPPWINEHIAEDAEKPSGAILRAAAELMAEHSPSSVSLREVAARAGVNYGLIHRHFGTKDKLLVALFQEFVLYGGEFITASDTIHEAIEGTFTADSGGWARIFSWVALDGVPPEQTFEDSLDHGRVPGPDREGVGRCRARTAAPRSLRPTGGELVRDADDQHLGLLRAVHASGRRLGGPRHADARAEVLELMQLLVHAARPVD